MVFGLNAYPQREIDSQWANQINPIFNGLDKSRVPHAVLLDYAMEFTDVMAYNGVLTDSTAIDVNVYSNIYKTLFMGKVTADTIYFPRLKSIAEDWASKRKIENQHQQKTLVLSGLFYNYSKLNPNALNSNKIIVSNNRYYDKYINGIWQNPYESHRVFALAPPLNSYNKRSFKVQLPASLFYTNTSATIQNIAVDFNDGQGYRNLNFDQDVNVDYPANGIYNWNFRLTLNNGQHYYAFTKVRIEQQFTTKPWKKHTISPRGN